MTKKEQALRAKAFKEALARQGFRWSRRFGGAWERKMGDESIVFYSYIMQSTHTAILKLDREDFPKYLAMDTEGLREFMQKFFDKNRVRPDGASFTIGTSYVENTLKPFMCALLEVS